MQKAERMAFVIAAWMLVASAALTAQQSPPGVCFSFNANLPPPPNALPLVAGGHLYFGFTSPQTTSIEQLDVYMVSSPAFPVTLDVYQVSASGLGPHLGGATLMPLGYMWTWAPFILSTPVSITAGAVYALKFTIGGVGSTLVGGDWAQGTLLAYSLACGPNPPTLSPPCSAYGPIGSFAARLIFRALTCGPTLLASASYVGTSCALGSAACFLGITGPPALGSTPVVFIAGGPGTFNLYGALGPATAGLDLGLGFGCSLYLDPASLQSLYLAGLEPIASLPAPALQPFTTSLAFHIPFDPTLAGTIVTAQVLVTGVPNGIPTPGGGIQITNALELHLGY